MTETLQEMSRIFALQSANQAEVRATTAAQRIAKLETLKVAIQASLSDAMAALAKDAGKPAFEALGECRSPLGEIDIAIAGLEEWMKPIRVETGAQAAPGARAEIIKEPKGRVLLFGPWNFPFGLVFQPLVGAIAAGNVCMVKPSELMPATGEVIGKVIREVFEEDEVAVISGGPDIAGELLNLPFDHVFFTGSTNVGKIVMSRAAAHLSGITLELGGKSPVLLDKGINFAKAANRISWSKFFNAGQICIAPDHVWVARENRDQFVGEVLRYIKDCYYQTGSLNLDDFTQIVDDRNVQRLTQLVDEAVSLGAKVVCGGQAAIGRNRTIEPTVLIDVPPNAAIMKEEVFGPIMPVLTYDNVEEVISKINAKAKPLALYVFSENANFVDDVLARTSSGGVTVNDVGQHAGERNLPFGGVGPSGMGAYHGIYTFLELSHQRSVYFQADENPAEQILRPPYAGKVEKLTQA